jgi:hypothetical protein
LKLSYGRFIASRPFDLELLFVNIDSLRFSDKEELGPRRELSTIKRHRLSRIIPSHPDFFLDFRQIGRLLPKAHLWAPHKEFGSIENIPVFGWRRRDVFKWDLSFGNCESEVREKNSLDFVEQVFERIRLGGDIMLKHLGGPPDRVLHEEDAEFVTFWFAGSPSRGGFLEFYVSSMHCLSPKAPQVTGLRPSPFGFRASNAAKLWRTQELPNI